MELALACNWDEGLIETAARFGVAELFGKLHEDAIGGGRVSFISRRVSKREAGRYIRRVQDAGMRFDYLLNGTCMGSREMTAGGQRELREVVAWAAGLGVRWFTVSIPYVAAIVRRMVPDAHLVVSMMAGVDSVERARQWEELGAEVVILFDNKDFPLIRALKAQTKLKLEVPANLSCMNRCFQLFYHGNVASHGSQTAGLGEYSLPLCEARCQQLKVKEPRRILAGQWMRPEDVHLYEELGVDRLKVLDRVSPTAQLARILEAYANRGFDGNLAELIPGFRQDRLDGYLAGPGALRAAAAFFRPAAYNVLKALPFKRRNRPPAFHVEGAALEGFLEGVMKRNCRVLSCAECGWCDRFAEKAVRFAPGERERFLADAEHNLEELESGDFFFYRPGRGRR